MYDVLTGFQPRRRSDKEHSQVWFTKCRVSGGPDTSTHSGLALSASKVTVDTSKADQN